MATLLLGAAGAAIGGSIGGSLFGLSSVVVGRAIGASIGRIIDSQLLTQGQTVKQSNQKLKVSQITSSAEGSPMPEVLGWMRLGGQVIWATRFKERVRKKKETQGGKGSNTGTTVETTTYTYSMSFAVAICAADGDVSLGRVWADGMIMDLSRVTYRFYDGAADQAPDPKISSVEGVGNTPAFRGTCYIVFEDLNLTPYGNRMPQITCEINRLPVTVSETSMEKALRGVNLIPGSGEFIYGTELYTSNDGTGNTRSENRNTADSSTDFIAGMEDLAQLTDNVGSVAIVVSWFGDSLDATLCTIRPKVDVKGKTVVPERWSVSGLDRASAQLVTFYQGSAAYGGTPSDHTMREAVTYLKDQGYRVMLYPFILMDTTDFPWRGRITGDPTNLLGTAQPGDFTLSGGAVQYTGPNEWTQRRMILHYATLLSDILQPGDAILTGTEMVGLSETQPLWGTGIASLITDVRTKLDPGVLVSYAADWSEYKYSSLTPVWNTADFIGIDWYMPTTDWRTDSDVDYTLDHFKQGVASGEYWDYFYADLAGRLANDKLPITDPQFRQKDIGYWRDNNHPGKEMWLTEFGCPAVDKGANQPNVFPDPKSSENAYPYFSNRQRNDLVQRLYIEGMLDYFKDNPSIVDPQNMFVWTWDARPYPEFPSLTNVWSDGPNWETGHWITGRLGGLSVADAVEYFLLSAGLTPAQYDLTSLRLIPTRVRGFYDDSLSSTATRIANLATTYLFDVWEDQGVLRFFYKKDENPTVVDLDDFVSSGSDDEHYARSRTKDTDLPDRVKVDFIDEGRAYNSASVDGHTITGYSRNVASVTSNAVLTTAYAKGLADVITQEQWVRRDQIAFNLPFGSEYSGNEYLTTVYPSVDFQFNGRRWRVFKTTIGDEIEVEAYGFHPAMFNLVDHAGSVPIAPPSFTPGQSYAVFMDVPVATADAGNLWSPRIAVRQKPWPGGVNVYRADGSGGFALNTIVPSENIIGETTTDFPAGPLWVWDNQSTVTVRLYDSDATLSSVSDASVLGGGNAMFVETPSGEWELFQFANAVLNMDGTFTLSRMLRGRLGTEPYIGDPTPLGARVVFVDDAFSFLEGTDANLGVSFDLRYGPSGVDFGDARYQDASVTPRGVAYRPYSPVQLSQTHQGLDIALAWLRRSRFGADSWSVTEIPLNEDFERYEVDILDGASAVRTIVVEDAQSVIYTAAQQIADFGSTQSTLDWVVYQISATFGRGAPAYG